VGNLWGSLLGDAAGLFLDNLREMRGERGRAWTASLPDARLVTVPGAAHAAWRDDPVTVFGAMRHFVRGEWPLGSVKP
jgi:pimeloyl-ACP methyl ester carboxylesterase